MVFHGHTKILENSMECSHISHQPQAHGHCNHPGGDHDILQRYHVLPFGYQTTETMVPLTLGFPQESHAGRRRLERGASQRTDMSPRKKKIAHISDDVV